MRKQKKRSRHADKARVLTYKLAKEGLKKLARAEAEKLEKTADCGGTSSRGRSPAA